MTDAFVFCYTVYRHLMANLGWKVSASRFHCVPRAWEGNLRIHSRRLTASTCKRPVCAMASQESSSKLTFYDSKNGCPFAHRVWLALVEKKIPFERKQVDLTNRPEDFTALYRSISGDSHLGKVPILLDGGQKMIESVPIVEWLDWKYPDKAPRLLPEDINLRYKAKLFVDVYMNNVSGSSLLLAKTKAELDEATQKLREGLKVVEKFLQIHAIQAEPGYFLGADYSIAEAALTPFVRRFTTALPALRNVDMVKMMEDEGLVRLKQWFKAALARPSIAETIPTDEQLIKMYQGRTQPISK